MKKRPCPFKTVLFATALLILSSCTGSNHSVVVRQPVDTVGFATHKWQVDSIIDRIERLQAGQLTEARAVFDSSLPLKVALSPHDDYTYVGYLYPALFRNVRSDVVILFGVGHKARNFGLENRLVFGSFSSWDSPAGTISVSPLQESIISKLPDEIYTIHDSLQAVEHSLEALVPFLEHYNPGTKIIPIIVPCMPFEKMESLAAALSSAIAETMDDAGLEWGKGWSLVISTDAVHYGNEDWGGRNTDRFGVDSAGYAMTVEYEKHIMNDMLAGELSPEKIRFFSECTVQDIDYHEYKWTWCGRYAVPVGLLTAYFLAETRGATLTGTAVGYSTSIAGKPIPINDIGMGVTAPAKLAHWVGYAAIGYR